MSDPPAGAAQQPEHDLQAANWSGRIPIHLTLAPTSLSSPTLPPPIHVLVSRNTYLHTGLQAAVQRLHPFAPASSFLATSSGAMFHVSEPDPGGGGGGGDTDDGGEDDKSGDGEGDPKTNGASNDEEVPTLQESRKNNNNKQFVYPVCWFEDEDTNTAVRWHLFVGVLFDMKPNEQQTLPWRLRLHFTNYPATQILPLDAAAVLTTVQASFKHSLKQSLTLQQGNSKGAMNVTKESHGLLWDAVVTSNIQVYRRVDLKNKGDPVSIPVRLLINNANPPIQHRLPCSNAGSLEDFLEKWVPDFADMQSCRICGVEAPLGASVYELWRHCAHPDQFLYIVVLTTSN